MILESYERMKEEVSVSHILLREEAGQYTMELYPSIMAIKDRLDIGEDFETVAREVSEDPSEASNGGKLGYFSAFQMVFPFEDAAYR